MLNKILESRHHQKHEMVDAAASLCGASHFHPLSVALSAICARNASILKCTLWTAGGRHRYGEILEDNNLLIDI